MRRRRRPATLPVLRFQHLPDLPRPRPPNPHFHQRPHHEPHHVPQTPPSCDPPPQQRPTPAHVARRHRPPRVLPPVPRPGKACEVVPPPAGLRLLPHRLHVQRQP